MKISLQNIEYKNHNLQKIQEQKASNFIAPKNITSSLQTLSNYNKANISFKSKSFSEQKKIFQEKLDSERDKDGLRIFYYDTINATIMRKLTPENIDLAEKLCFAKDANGEYLFENKNLIYEILPYVDKKNAKFAEKLCFSTYTDGNKEESFTYHISDILKNLNDKNLAFTEKLCFAQDKYGNSLFARLKNTLPTILELIDENNIHLLEKLCFGKDEKGNDLYKEKDDIPYILTYLPKGSEALAEKLYFLKDEFGGDFFKDKQAVLDIISQTKHENVRKFTEKIMFAQDDNGNYLFPHREFIPSILEEIRDYNIDFAERMCFDEKIRKNPDEISNIAPILTYTLINCLNSHIIEHLFFLKDENGEDIIKNKNSINNIHLPSTQIDLSKIKPKTFENFFKAANGFENIIIREKQNDAGFEFIATKKVKDGDNYVIKKIISNEKGELVKNTTYFKDGEITSWSQNSDKFTITNAKEINRKDIIKQINLQIEIINDENNEPSYIIETRPSKLLNGVFETTKYTLSNYPEDMDILKAIQNGTITGGEKLASTEQQEDGTILYKRTYTHKGTTTNRLYSEKRDETGNIQKNNYNYEIVDENNKKLLQMNRSWQQNSDGTTTTIINGEKYTTKFDDENYGISIINQNGEETTFDLKYTSSNSEIQKLYDYIKKLPADTLLTLQNCEKIYIVDEFQRSGIDYNFFLKIYLNQAIFAHEMGHIKNSKAHEINKETLVKNQDLIDTYNKEMEDFRKEYPTSVNDVLTYFSPLSTGSASTGLGELIAETNALMTTCSDIKEELQLRSEYLLRYFPKTIAKAAELLGYNAINN